jgi:hypothetical protein
MFAALYHDSTLSKTRRVEDYHGEYETDVGNASVKPGDLVNVSMGDSVYVMMVTEVSEHPSGRGEHYQASFLNTINMEEAFAAKEKKETIKQLKETIAAQAKNYAVIEQYEKYADHPSIGPKLAELKELMGFGSKKAK